MYNKCKICIHFGAVPLEEMFLDYSFMTTPLYLNLHENFVGSIFSGPMIPMMAAYGLFTIGIYFLWGKMKKAILLAHQKDSAGDVKAEPPRFSIFLP